MMVKITGRSYEVATIRILMKRELRRRVIPHNRTESTQSLMDKLTKRK